MAVEQGIVIRIGAQGPATAWVITTRSSACESCASRDSCNPGANGKTQEVEAINAAGAKVGDHIQLTVGTRAMLKATFLVYVFPILSLLAGALIGDRIAPGLGLHPSAASVIMAFILFAFALVIVRLGGQCMARKEAYRPKIVRILKNFHQNQTDAETAAFPDQDPKAG
jgi:sigma-E factor negative regulatory protein RseC